MAAEEARLVLIKCWRRQGALGYVVVLRCWTLLPPWQASGRW